MKKHVITYYSMKKHEQTHDPFFHEMPSNRRSRVENWMYRRHFSMCFFVVSKSPKKYNKLLKRNQHMIKYNVSKYVQYNRI